jgi:hypothetical protein
MNASRKTGAFRSIAIGVLALFLASTCLYGVRRRSRRTHD